MRLVCIWFGQVCSAGFEEKRGGSNRWNKITKLKVYNRS